MRIIPLQPVPAQQLSVTLGDQVCRIRVYQKSTGMFLDLYLSDALIAAGCICQNLNRILRAGYSGFVGDLMFLDSEGSADPVYSELGSRFNLAYLDAADLAAIDAAQAAADAEAF